MVTKEELKRLIDSYNRGESLVEDEVYDQMLEEYLKEHGEEARPYLRSKQTDVVNNLVCTLPKTYGVRTPMREGQKTYQQWCDSKKINDNMRIVVQPKFDGCSVAYDFATKRFFTRGDYENGESIDVTELFECNIDWLEEWKMDNIDLHPIGVKFEAILAVECYEHWNRTHLDTAYKRPRDFVAAAISSRDVEMCEIITLIPLRGLSHDGREFVSPDLIKHGIVTTVRNYERIESFIKDLLHNNATCDFVIGALENVITGIETIGFKVDGVVVSVVEEKELFIVDDNEVAIKILKDVRQTKLRDIIWQVGNTGKVTPVAILQPVQFDNVTVDHVTLSTFDRVIKMDLRHNDTVDIMYNIVPYFVGTQHDGDIKIGIPNNCPICGEPFSTSMKTVRCLNPKCKSVIIGGIARYCEKMKMVGLSNRTIEILYDNGVVKSIPDLYRITPTMISTIPGFGDTSESNIINTIRDASKEVPIHKWFGAMPINDISDKTWKQIFDTIFYDVDAAVTNISNLINTNAQQSFVELFTTFQIPNVGVAKIRSIVTGLYEKWDLIRETFPYIKFYIPTSQIREGYKGTVAMTGTRDQELAAKLKRAGWNVVDYNTKISFLVIPHKGFTSNKTESAIKHNIPIRTVEETLDMLQ